MPVAVFTGDGRHLLATGAGGTIRIWDAHSWEQVGELGGPATPTPPSGTPGVPDAAPGDFRRIAPSPDASMKVASTFLEGPAYLWDIAPGPTITQLAFSGAYVGTVRFSRDGERLIVDLEPPGDNDLSDIFDPTAGRVEVWDWRDGRS